MCLVLSKFQYFFHFFASQKNRFLKICTKKSHFHQSTFEFAIFCTLSLLCIILPCSRKGRSRTGTVGCSASSDRAHSRSKHDKIISKCKIFSKITFLLTSTSFFCATSGRSTLQFSYCFSSFKTITSRVPLFNLKPPRIQVYEFQYVHKAIRL